MTKSLLLLNLALALGWTLENEDDDGRVQVRYGNTDDAQRLDWLNGQIDADAVGEDGNPLLQSLVVKLQFPSDTLCTDALSPDSRAICAALDKLTAAHEKANLTAQDMADQMGEFFSQLGPDLAQTPASQPPISQAPKPGTLGAMKPQEVAAMLGTVGTALGAVVEGCISRPSDLLQVNQAVLALLNRQIEAEERIYGRFCDMVERATDKISATFVQIQSTQLAHEQRMKQAETDNAERSKINAQFDAFFLALERFAEVAVSKREQAETAKAQPETPPSDPPLPNASSHA